MKKLSKSQITSSSKRWARESLHLSIWAFTHPREIHKMCVKKLMKELNYRWQKILNRHISDPNNYHKIMKICFKSRNNPYNSTNLVLRSSHISCNFQKDTITYSNSSHLSIILWTFCTPDSGALPTLTSEKWSRINPRENSPSNTSDKYCKLSQISIITNGRGNLARWSSSCLFRKTWKKYCAPKRKVYNMRSPLWVIKDT